MLRLKTLISLPVALGCLSCATNAPAVEDPVVIAHSAVADQLERRVQGRCGDQPVYVSRSLDPDRVRVTVGYGPHQNGFNADEPFARDLIEVQHTGYETLLCRPDGGLELIVTSVDVTQPDRFHYTVTRFDSRGRLESYSGLLEESRDSVRRFLQR